MVKTSPHNCCFLGAFFCAGTAAAAGHLKRNPSPGRGACVFQCRLERLRMVTRSQFKGQLISEQLIFLLKQKDELNVIEINGKFR